MSQTQEDAGQRRPSDLNPSASPFELPPIGIPFGKDSAEARAIKRVIEEADRERAAAPAERSS